MRRFYRMKMKRVLGDVFGNLAEFGPWRQLAWDPRKAIHAE